MRQVIIILCLLVVTCIGAQAGSPLVIGVEERDWTGHYYWENGELRGVDADIFRSVARRLGYEIEFQPLPWRRANIMAEDKLTDGVFDLSATKSRLADLHFVTPPLSTEPVVFWVRKGDSFSYQGKFERSLWLGVMAEEDWSDWFARDGRPRVVRFSSLKAAFNSLMEGRIDVFGNYLLSGQKWLCEHNLEGEVVASKPVVPNHYYVAFSRKPGHDALAKRFSKALAEFFDSPDYLELLKANGIKEVEQAYHPSKIVRP